MLNRSYLVREAEADRQFDFILILILPVLAPALCLPEHRISEYLFPGNLPDIINYPLLIKEVLLLKFTRSGLAPEPKGNSGVHHRLPTDSIQIIFNRDINVRKDVQVWKPAGTSACLALILGQRRLFQLLPCLSHNLPSLKVELVLKTVPPDSDVHVTGSILGGAGAKSIQTQGVFVIFSLIIFIFATGIEFAEDKLPVPTLLLLVPIHGTPPPLILHFNTVVEETGYGNQLSMPLSGLVNGVGKNLKHRLLAAI